MHLLNEVAGISHRAVSTVGTTDVTGESRLLREIEEATLAAIESDFFEALDANIVGHNGRIFKKMVDGLAPSYYRINSVPKGRRNYFYPTEDKVRATTSEFWVPSGERL